MDPVEGEQGGRQKSSLYGGLSPTGAVAVSSMAVSGS